MRASLVAILVLCFASVASAQSGRVQPTPSPTPEETVKVETEEIKLNILATDESGKFFRDVLDTDLVITDNNILHQPASVRRTPANVLIVMDTGGEMRFKKSLNQTRNTAKALINSLASDDQISIIQYSDKVGIVSDWTSSREELSAAIGRTKFGRRSVFVDAVRRATELLLEQPRDNRHLVLITDGTDSFYHDAERSAAMKMLLSTDISVHVISYTRMESDDIEPRTRAFRRPPPPRGMPDEIAATLPNGARDIARAPRSGRL